MIPHPDDSATGLDSPASVGPRLQVEHLHAGGRRRLAYAASPDPRLESLVDSRLGLASSTASVLQLESLSVEEIDAETADGAVRRWHAQGIDGVVAYNDDVAALVVGAALRAGLRIPQDLAVVGHDDSPIAAMFFPSITSVHIDDVGLGRFFAELALSAANGTPVPSWQSDSNVTLRPREST